MNLGQRIKQIRLSRGETTETFARHFDASKGTISKWENGIYKPNPDRIKQIAELGNMTVVELLQVEKSYKLIVETLKKELNEKLRNVPSHAGSDYKAGIEDATGNILAIIDRLEKEISE